MQSSDKYVLTCTIFHLTWEQPIFICTTKPGTSVALCTRSCGTLQSIPYYVIHWKMVRWVNSKLTRNIALEYYKKVDSGQGVSLALNWNNPMIALCIENEKKIMITR